MTSTDTTTVTTTTPSRLIALDPGKTTGIAEWTAAEGWTATELQVDEVWRHLGGRAVQAHEAGETVQLVSESFLITVNTAKNSQAGWSLELIGFFRYLAWAYGWPELKLQTPQVAKSFATDGKLRSMGWWVKGRGGHANDASRHLLTYAATRAPWAETIIGKDKLIEMAQA